MSPSVRRWIVSLALASGCFLGLAHCSGILDLVIEESRALSPLPYERRSWLENERTLWSVEPRMRMAEWLVDRNELIGRTMPDIEAMLGPPQDRTVVDGGKRFKYELGERRGDGWVLIVESDRKDLVVSTSIDIE